MNAILTILIGSIFVNNFAMSRFYGICPFLGVSKKLETAFGMGMAVTFVMAAASLVAYLVNAFLLVPLGLEYLQTIAFILVIAVLVQIVEMAIKKMSPGLYQALGVYLPLITTNCAVLGVAQLNEQLMTCVAEADADLAEGGYFNFKAGYRRAHPHKAGRMQPMEAYGMPWGKVMRRTLFERAGFPEGYWFEDSVLHQLILPGAQGCIGIADTVVERRLAAQSAGHISRGNVRSVDAVWVTLSLMRDRKALGLSNDQAHYEYLLDMAVLSQYRLEGLDEASAIKTL